MRCDERTIAYAARRRSGGLTRKEILRCLKRYIAREVFALLRTQIQVSNTAESIEA